MDRHILLDHLAQADRHVDQGERHLAQQRAQVDALERDGHDATVARELLDTLEQTQVLHLADRDRIRRELNDEGWPAAR